MSPLLPLILYAKLEETDISSLIVRGIEIPENTTQTQ